jgi:hypothetical protein
MPQMWNHSSNVIVFVTEAHIKVRNSILFFLIFVSGNLNHKINLIDVKTQQCFKCLQVT